MATGITLSNVINSYNRPRIANSSSAFWGALLGVFCLSEMLGPLMGWRTITGHLYIAAIGSIRGREQVAPELSEILLALAVQLTIETIAAYNIAHTNWRTWFLLRARRISHIVAPDPNMRATLLGVLAGVVITWVISTILGDLPYWRGPLIASEGVVALVSFLATTLALLFPKVNHHHITHLGDRVFERIPQAPMPVQLFFDQNSFNKSILLKRSGAYYETCSINGPIRIDVCEHAIINYDILSNNISGPVKALSANLLECEGKFSLETDSPNPGVRLKADVADVLIKNLYERKDLANFLKECLTGAIHKYAKLFDTDVKTKIEDYRLKILTSRTQIAKASQGAGLSLDSSDVYRGSLLVAKERSLNTVNEAKKYLEHWRKARKLQATSNTELPKAFEAYIFDHFTAKLDSQKGDTIEEHKNIIKTLLQWGRILLFCDKTIFISTAANEADQLLESEIKKAEVELTNLEKQTDDQKVKDIEQLRVMVEKATESGLLRTSGGKGAVSAGVQILSRTHDQQKADLMPQESSAAQALNEKTNGTSPITVEFDELKSQNEMPQSRKADTNEPV